MAIEPELRKTGPQSTFHDDERLGLAGCSPSSSSSRFFRRSSSICQKGRDLLESLLPLD